MNNIYGYIRVSSVDHNEARQLAAMQRLQVHEKHIAHLSRQAVRQRLRAAELPEIGREDAAGGPPVHP